jgi:hypothetical protein
VAKKVRINHKMNILVLNDVEMAMVRRSLKVRAERLRQFDNDDIENAGNRALVDGLCKLHVDLGGVM